MVGPARSRPRIWRDELSAAIAMLRAMEMKHWLPKAEAELSRAIA
jgi:hypothetical protein